jgi:hypothetical protein
MASLSFCILDDLEFMYGPIHKELDNFDNATLKKNINEMVSIFKWTNYNGCNGKIDLIFGRHCFDKTHKHFEYYDASEYFDDDFFNSADENINNIANDLLKKNFFVMNRYNKYYVIAFSINFTRFEIYSKDCQKKFINWNHSGNISEEGIIYDPDYNENPITKAFKTICDDI